VQGAAGGAPEQQARPGEHRVRGACMRLCSRGRGAVRRCEALAGATAAAPAPAVAAPPAAPRLALPYRVGHGFDLHRLEAGPYKLILGGLEIPHDRGCVAHSDGAGRARRRAPPGRCRA